MALSPRLDLRQSQSLVMTPQLQQAIKLLQLSNIELSAFVEAELEQNPLLERDDGPPATAEEVRETQSADTEPPEAPMVCPVMNSARSEARKATRPDTSSGRDSRPTPLEMG